MSWENPGNGEKITFLDLYNKAISELREIEEVMNSYFGDLGTDPPTTLSERLDFLLARQQETIEKLHHEAKFKDRIYPWAII